MFLSYRTSEGKWHASKVLRIENINEINLNFLYNCTVASEGDIDTKSFILLKKGIRKFYFWKSVEILNVAAERLLKYHHVLILHTWNQASERWTPCVIGVQGRTGAQPMLEPLVPRFQAENDNRICILLPSIICQFLCRNHGQSREGRWSFRTQVLVREGHGRHWGQHWHSQTIRGKCAVQWRVRPKILGVIAAFSLH